ILLFSPQLLLGQVMLTPEEKAWIELHQEVIFGADEDWAPLVIVNDFGDIEGYDWDMLNEIEKLTGLAINIKTGNWSELVEDVRNRQIDGLTYSAPVEERTSFLNYSDPYIKFEVGFYGHVNGPEVKSISALSGKKIAVQRDDQFSNNFIDSLGTFNKIELTDRQDIVAALLTGQVDYYFGAIDLDYYLTTNVIPGIKLAYLIPDKGNSAVFSIRKDFRILQSIINKALAEIPEAERAGLMRKWGLGVQSENTVNKELIFTIVFIAFGLVSIVTAWAFTLKSQVDKRKKAEAALEAYKINLESLIENSAGIIYLIDARRRVKVFNSNFEKFIHNVSGMNVNEGDDIVKYVPEKYKEKWTERYQRGLDGDKYDIEDYTDIIGMSKTYVTYFNPVSVGNRVIGLSCFTEDISAYASLNRYMVSMMNNAYDYIFIKDKDRRFIVASQSMANVMGLQSWRDFKDKTDHEIHFENADQFEEQERAVIANAESFVNVEKSFFDKNGALRWVQSTNLPILDEDDQVIGLLGVSRDITRTKQQDESNRTMLSVLDNSGDFVAFFDREMKFLYMNQVARSFYGSDDYLGQYVGDVMDKKQFERRKLNVLKLIKSGGVDREEVNVYRPQDGKKLTIDSVVVAVNDDDGRFLCFGNIGRDVTERNKLQEEVVAARLQKEVMLASMNAEDLERSRLAHELHDGIQQRLATLSISLQVSQEKPQLIPSNIKVLNNIIDEVRDVSHNLSPSTLKSMGLAHAVADEMNNLSKSDTTKFKYYEDVGGKRFDALLELNLFRIFQESITNITKHANANEVMVQLLLTDKTLSLIIEDDGVGFELGKIDHDGLGLSNMKRRIETFNGRINIDSSPNQGTTVMLDVDL
ncbi:MAG: transporter substrate-binding domain-containing protein, partial [Bacteroidota bacterium]